MRNIYQCILTIMLSSLASLSFAWDHSIELGYGYSHDPNHSRYNNSGFLLSGDLLPLQRSSAAFWSINGGLGQWTSTAPKNKNLTTAALALALRLYAFNVKTPTYLLASGGPAYLSSRQYGLNTQGSNLAFQVYGGLGVELENIDINFRLIHYSNAHLASPNEGYNILYMLSVGYLF